MERIIRLANLDHIPTPAHDRFTPAEMAAARKVMVSRRLRWDNETGCLYDNHGLLSRYVNQSEFEPHSSEEEVMEWEFSRYIANSASRVKSGFTP